MMTLEQKTKVAKAIHEGMRRNGTVVIYSTAFERIVADAIDAHLAQQPNLAAIREVIAEISYLAKANSEQLEAWADKLTAALQENAK